MRKLLLGLITLMLLGLSIYMAVYGIELLGLQISGIPTIKEEDSKLETKINTASKLRNTEYPQNITLLEGAYKKLVAEKENYEQLLALGVDENGQPLNKIQEYEIEKIWVTMGNYAQKQGVDLKLDVTSNNSISKTYDLTFTVTGGYIQITDFLYDIERDSSLVFKLENFKLVAGETTDVLVGTFVCKDIKLNITESNLTKDKEDENSKTTTDSKSNTNTNTTNTNTTNTNSTSNTTNTSPATNTNS